MTVNLLKKAVEVGFDKRQKPSLFLANLFKEKQLNTIKIEIQGRSVKSVYAVDVKLGTGGRRVDLSSHDTKDFVIPEYNNFATISEEDMFKVQLGEVEYSQNIANVANMINDRQVVISDIIRRAEEKQAADALFTGKIVLCDGTEISFNKRSTHDVSKASEKWNNDAHNPLKHIEEACQLIIDDGKISASEFNFVASSAVVNAFMANKQVRESSNWNNGIKRTDINMPIEKTPGVMFHGQISCGAYVVNIWSYNEKYEIPVGYGFAGEGTQVPYIPNGKCLIIPANPNFERFYGAINNVNAQATMGGAKLQLVKAQQLAYAYDELYNGSALTKAGVKSRVLLVPTDVDCFVTLKDLI